MQDIIRIACAFLLGYALADYNAERKAIAPPPAQLHQSPTKYQIAGPINEHRIMKSKPTPANNVIPHKDEFIPLNLEKRSALTTKVAAQHLNRAEQTLRLWSCNKKGPIKPISVGGRLAWKTADIKRLLGVKA